MTAPMACSASEVMSDSCAGATELSAFQLDASVLEGKHPYPPRAVIRLERTM